MACRWVLMQTRKGAIKATKAAASRRKANDNNGSEASVAEHILTREERELLKNFKHDEPSSEKGRLKALIQKLKHKGDAKYHLLSKEAKFYPIPEELFKYAPFVCEVSGIKSNSFKYMVILRAKDGIHCLCGYMYTNACNYDAHKPNSQRFNQGRQSCSITAQG